MEINNFFSDYIKLYPRSKIKGKIKLLGSKSISNRILLLSILSNDITIIRNLLISEDTLVMIKIFKLLKIKLGFDYINNNYIIYGCGGYIFLYKKINLFVGNAGTVIRPLTAILSFIKGSFILFGTKRMHKRPILDLVNVLNNMGMKIKYLKKIGYPPLFITDGKINTYTLKIKCDISSQFLTSLLLALGFLYNHKIIFIKVIGKLTSKPYIDITISLMFNFSINVENNKNIFKIILNKGYKSPGIFYIEGDISSASYFLAAGIITGSLIRVEGVGYNSIQGDMYFINVLRMMGGIINVGSNWIESTSSGPLNFINVDCNNFPDAAMTIAVIILYTNGVSLLRNISNWKFKETNRLLAMKNELKKVGAKVTIGIDFIKIIPPKFIKSAIINTYNDHRIAMCFSLISLNGFIRNGNFIKIINPNCVYKTFPNYFTIFNLK